VSVFPIIFLFSSDKLYFFKLCLPDCRKTGESFNRQIISGHEISCAKVFLNHVVIFQPVKNIGHQQFLHFSGLNLIKIPQPQQHYNVSSKTRLKHPLIYFKWILLKCYIDETMKMIPFF
jgi:hypothetical protein